MKKVVSKDLEEQSMTIGCEASPEESMPSKCPKFFLKHKQEAERTLSQQCIRHKRHQAVRSLAIWKAVVHIGREPSS